MSSLSHYVLLVSLVLVCGVYACGGNEDGAANPNGNQDSSGEAPFAGNVAPSDPQGELGGTAGNYVYNGVPFSGQCVPAARRYYESEHGITFPRITTGNTGAYLLWDVHVPDPTYWARVANSGFNMPTTEDMLVMDQWSGNPYGHVAVVASVINTSNRDVEVVDSNWVGYEKGGRHTIRIDNRTLGWYRPKGSGVCVPTAEVPGDGLDQDCDGDDLPLVTLRRCYRNVSSPQNTDWMHSLVAPSESCQGELDGHEFAAIYDTGNVEEISLGSGYKAARLYECVNNNITAVRYVTVGHRETGAGWSCRATAYYVGTNQSITDLGAQELWEGHIESKTTWLLGPHEDLSQFGGTSTLAFWAWNVQ